MAGDWIKVQTNTARKPEVMRLARMLGISRREMIGTLIDFWVWLDNSTVDGVVDGVGAHEVDEVMSCPGFAMGLATVGWVQIDSENMRITVPNFTRHNGESAKKRVLKNERQARWRANSVDARVDQKASTREEKRRDTSTNVDVGRKPKTVLQEPSAKHQELADQLGLSCQAEFQKYRDHFAANGKSHKDEDAGFRVWLRNAERFKPRVVAGREPTLAEKRAANMAAITGQVRRERVIECTAESMGLTPFPALPGDLGEQGDDDVGGRATGRAYRDVG